MEKGQYVFKNYFFDLVGLIYISGLFTTIRDLLRLHPRKVPFLFQTLGGANSFWSQQIKANNKQQIVFEFLMYGSFQNVGNVGLLKC